MYLVLGLNVNETNLYRLIKGDFLQSCSCAQNIFRRFPHVNTILIHSSMLIRFGASPSFLRVGVCSGEADGPSSFFFADAFLFHRYRSSQPSSHFLSEKKEKFAPKLIFHFPTYPIVQGFFQTHSINSEERRIKTKNCSSMVDNRSVYSFKRGEVEFNLSTKEPPFVLGFKFSWLNLME